MSASKLLSGVLLSAALCACASNPDHFYTLTVWPAGDRPALTPPLLHVRLDATVPPLVDRSEMVMSTADNGVQIWEHERWAVALPDQVLQTLSRDLERRRSDILVADRRFDQGKSAVVVKVDIVRLSASRGGHATLEARWHITDSAAGVDVVDGAAFDIPMSGAEFAGLAQAYSEALGQLADKLAAALPAS